MKKNLNKVLALTLAFTVVGSTAAYAEVMKGETTATPVPISADADAQAEASAYISNTGKITEIADTEDGNKVFTMDNENGGLRFVVAPTTTIVDRETGSVITADKLTEGMEVVDVKDVTVPEGTEFPVTITFKAAGVTSETRVEVLHYTGSEWEVVKSKAGEGTITATFTSLSPVAFVIDKDTMSPTGSTSTEAPRTGMGMVVPAAIAIGAVAFIGFVALGKKKAR